MTFKAILRTIVFLALLFVLLYVGMNNTHVIDFHFPIAGTTAKTPIRSSAALIYFGVFAIGVFAGMALHTGNSGGKSGGAKSGKSSK